MKKTIITAAAGLVAGLVLTMAVVWFSAPALMLKEDVSRYDFAESLQVFEQTALANGWKIPTTHDMQKTMHSFGKDVLAGYVFELCHPVHAYEILSRDNERIVMSMMPCRVAIYERSDGKVYVSRMNTSLMGKMMGGVVPRVMKQASAESEQIINALIR